MTHGYGEDYSTWARDWRNVDTQSPEKLLWYLKVILMVQADREVWDAMNNMVNDMMEGRNRWILEKSPNGNWYPDGSSNLNLEDELMEALNELFYDVGIRNYDSYHQDDASFEDFKVVYFDNYGVPHRVEIDRNVIRQAEL